MKKSLLKKEELTTRLASYAASTGALLALGSVANGQVEYSGIQNLELNMPTDYLEIDMDGDLTNDFGFYIYGTFGSYTPSTASSIIYRYGNGLAAILNPRTDSYKNSWMTRYTYLTINSSYYTFPLANGLGSGVTVDAAQSMWSNLTYPYYAGIMAYGFYTSVSNGTTNYFYGYAYGDFFGEEKYLGVRFYIGTEQHYGWIRASVGDMLDPLTIIDWAYESTPGDSILTGAGDDFGPEVTMEAGITTTHELMITVSLSFNEIAYELELSDILVGNGDASNLVEIVRGREYTFDVTANAEGEVSVSLPAGVVYDYLGNENDLATTSWTYIAPVAVDVENTEGIRIYPNPVNSTLHVELENEASIQIVDLTGKVVYQQEHLLNETIDVSGFNPGVYIVRVQDNENVTQHKIIIE